MFDSLCFSTYFNLKFPTFSYSYLIIFWVLVFCINKLQSINQFHFLLFSVRFMVAIYYYCSCCYYYWCCTGKRLILWNWRDSNGSTWFWNFYFGRQKIFNPTVFIQLTALKEENLILHQKSNTSQGSHPETKPLNKVHQTHPSLHTSVFAFTKQTFI